MPVFCPVEFWATRKGLAVVGIGGILGVLLGVVAVLAVVLVVGLARRRADSPQGSAAHIQSPAQIVGQSSTARLAEADQLLTNGQISQAEHAEMRARILGIGQPPSR